MEAYETIMSSTRAPFTILPRPVDADGNTVTTAGGADDDRYPLVPEETTIVAIWLQLLNKAGLNPRSVLWNKVKLLEPLVVLGHDAVNELTQAPWQPEKAQRRARSSWAKSWKGWNSEWSGPIRESPLN